MPNWVKVAIDGWTFAAGIADGHVIRPVIRGSVRGGRLGEKVAWQMLQAYPVGIGTARDGSKAVSGALICGPNAAHVG